MQHTTKQKETWDSPLLDESVDFPDLKPINPISTVRDLFTRFRLSEGITIGAITGLGYFSAYLSDASYKAFFGLPSLYVDVNLNVVILSIFSLVLVIWAIALSMIDPVLKKFGPFILPLIIPLIAASLLAIKLDFKVANSWGNIISIFVFSILSTGALMVFVYFRKWLLASLLFILLVIFTARFTGEFIASNQTEYLVLKGNPSYVVVDIYKDALIMMPVDLKTRTITPEYKFVDQKSEYDQAIKLERMEIGPLKLKE